MDVRADQTSGHGQRAAERAVLSLSSVAFLADALGGLADRTGPGDLADRRSAAALAARDLERHLDDLSDSGDQDDRVVLGVEDVVARLRRAAAG